MAIFTPQELMARMREDVPILERIAETRDILEERVEPPFEPEPFQIPQVLSDIVGGVIQPIVTLFPIPLKPTMQVLEVAADVISDIPDVKESPILAPIALTGEVFLDVTEPPTILSPTKIAATGIEAAGEAIEDIEWPSLPSLPTLPDIFGGFKDVGKYALIAGALILGYFVLTRKK